MLNIKSRRRVIFTSILGVVVLCLVAQVAQHKSEVEAMETVRKLGGHAHWKGDWFTVITGIEVRLFWTVSVVDFNYQPLTDEQFQELSPKLAKLHDLQHLYLQGTNLTDRSLPLLKTLPPLKHVTIGRTPISRTSPSELDALGFARAE